MCDQTEVAYLEGDVVWVKFGALWWPGVVKDLEKDEEGRAILQDIKNKPIAAVKFFDEDNYEFVKNLDHIYHYSCRRKDEFIKKGLDKYRTGASHMKKFPADVVKAESLTNGDINIIDDPKFEPEIKHNYSEIFGSAKKKKDGLSSVKKGRNSQHEKSTPLRSITHQRFLQRTNGGDSGHEVRTRIQPPNYSPEDEPKGCYACHVCRFRTTRLNVIVAHHSLLHSVKKSVVWASSEPPPIRKRTANRQRKPKPKNLFEVFEAELSSDDETLGVKKKKRKEAAKISKTKPKQVAVAPEVKKQVTDALLADWMVDEDEDANKAEITNESRSEEVEEENENNEKMEEEIVKVQQEAGKVEEEIEKVEEEVLVPEKKQENEKSCFDFDEEDEGFIGMSNANTYGRKIPRVIPIKDKTDLGLDLEVEELFKRKAEIEHDKDMEDLDEEENEEKDEPKSEVDSKKEEKAAVERKPAGVRGRKKGKRKSEDTVEDVEKKAVVVMSTLASTRARRPGSRKSYLNEVIEKIDDNGEILRELTPPPQSTQDTEVKKQGSRRKQELKTTFLDDEQEEAYTEMVELEKSKVEKVKKQRGRKRKESSSETKTNKVEEDGDDLTAQIDSLLAETSMPTLPSPSKSRKEDLLLTPKRLSTLSMDYSPEEVKTPDPKPSEESAESTKSETPPKSIRIPTAAVMSAASPVKTAETSDSASHIVTVVKPTTSPGGSTCVLLPGGKKIDLKKVLMKPGAEKTVTTGPGGIKTIHIRQPTDSVLTTTKLKGQTILQDSAGRYMIVKPPPPGRQTALTSKQPGFGNKVMIVRNQKIIKMDQGRVVTPDSSEATPGSSQHILKLVPDSRGSLLKKVVPHKQVILHQGTPKLLVSTPSSAASQSGASAQNPGTTVKEDIRYVTNYKGGRRTLLIQGPSGEVLKQAGVTRPTVGRVLQTQTTTTPVLKTKPKILMRTSSGQSEYVVTPGSSDSPTYVMKRTGTDGKFEAQKIIRKLPGRPGSTTASGSIQLVQATTESGQKTLILAQGGHITTVQPKTLTSKILRLTSKGPESVTPKVVTRTVQKIPEIHHPPPEAPVVVTVPADQAPTALLQTQMVAMPGPIGADGNPTYVLVTVDEHGFAQPMENQLISYSTSSPQQQNQQVFTGASNSNVILLNATSNDEAPMYSAPAGQDILAEALANTNVLEGSITADMESIIPSVLLPPSIPPSVVQETSVTLQKPIMTPLEIPSSVAPDTSGLEPPPLPPTPTEEDVLMDDRDDDELMIAENQDGRAADEETDEQGFQELQLSEGEGQEPGDVGDGGEVEEENHLPEEGFVIEDSQEDQETNSFQSMPLLNDEPDTSDDVPIENQDFEAQRSRLEAKGFTAVTEPPSSTNNDFIVEYQDMGAEHRDFDSSSQDEPEEAAEEPRSEEKEGIQSDHMVAISEDAHLGAYEIDPHFTDVSQKRFQEETEVTSTTDEFTTRASSM